MECRDIQDHTISTVVGRRVTRVPSSCPSLTECPKGSCLGLMFSLFGRLNTFLLKGLTEYFLSSPGAGVLCGTELVL